MLGDGVSDNFEARFRVLASRAGIALGCPKGTVQEDFWLHRLYLDMLENNSEQLFAASREGGIIVRVCVASATFCARLERQALEQSEPGNSTGADRLRINANQTESSCVENKANSGQSVESQIANTAVSCPSQKGSRSQRGAQAISQAVELGQGGVRFVRQGKFTVALPCGIGGEIFDNSTITAVGVSYDILSVELVKVYSIVKAKRGDIDGTELRKQFRRSPLAGVADGHDWDDWAEGFSPKNSQRGRPKGAALTFLERKMALERGTIKSYLSRSKKRPPRGK
jgi:hypothetical protein